MKSRTIILGSVASFAVVSLTLAGSLMLGSSAFAQTMKADGNPPQYSTPAEQAETQQLNQQYTNGTTQSPAALNGQADATYGGSEGAADPNAANPNTNAQAQYGQQMQQYQDQQQQYQDQQQQYQDQRGHYEAQKDAYYHNLRRWDEARWAYDYPTPVMYEYDGGRLERLDLVTDANERLAQVPVESPNGAWVGRIRNVDVRPDGRVARIEIALNRRVSVWVDAHHFRFDPNERVAFTNLTRDDLWNMNGTVVNEPM